MLSFKVCLKSDLNYINLGGNKTEAVVKNKSPNYKRPDSDGFSAEFYHTFQ